MNREKSLIKNIFIIGLGTFLPKFASIITLPIVTGYLTQKEYGTYDLILVLISLILPLATLQIQSAAFRFLVENRNNTNEVCSIVTNILSFTVITSILPILVIYIFLYKYDFIMRCAICLYFFFDIIFQTIQQICRGLGENAVYSSSTVINSILNMLMSILLIKHFKLGLLGVIISLVISNLFSAIVIGIKCNIIGLFKINFVSRKKMGELISYSWPLIPNNLSSWIMTLSDRLLLALFMGTEINAIYAISKKIPNLLTSVQSTFSLAWQENASLSSSDKDIDTYYSVMFSKIFSIVIGACSALIGLSPILFRILIRGDYSQSYLQMPILFLGMVFMTLSSYLAGIYIADKKTKEIGVTTTIAAIINLIFDLIAIPYIGMYAASISTLISYIFLFVYRLIDLRKYHAIEINYHKMFLFLTILSSLCILSAINRLFTNIFVFIVSMCFGIGINKTFIFNIIKNMNDKVILKGK